MSIDETKACKNTDKELWRTVEEDYYSKHKLYLTENGGLTLCQGGTCITLPPEDWFKLANQRFKTDQPVEETQAQKQLGQDIYDEVFDAWLTKLVGDQSVQAHCQRLTDKIMKHFAGYLRLSEAYRLTEIRKEIHFPECWDTVAYPTIYDALHELAGCVGCSECKYPGKNPVADQRPSEREISDDKYAADHVRWTLTHYGKESADKIEAIYAAGKAARDQTRRGTDNE